MAPEAASLAVPARWWSLRIQPSTSTLLVLLRWVIFLMLFSLTAYQEEDQISSMSVQVFMLFGYAASNLLLPVLYSRIKDDRWLNGFIFLIDIGFITLMSYLSFGWKEDLFLLYFVIIFMAAIQSSLSLTFVITVVASLVYFSFLESGQANVHWSDPNVVIRMPLFYVVALFTGYLSQRTKAGDAKLKEEQERGKKIRKSAIKMEQMLQDEKAASVNIRAVDKHKWNFVNDMANQLRGSLQTVQGYCSIIESSVEKLSPKELQKNILSIKRNTVRLEKLAEQILTLMDIDRKSFFLYRDPVDIRQVVEKCTTLLKGYSGRHQVHAKLPDAEVLVNCDAMRIEQVVWNLLMNAIKYSPKGGLVCIDLGLKKGGVRVSVSDPGIGIPASQLDRIFEPYYRVDHCSHAGIQGTGIGLYLMKRIIEDHGGWVRAESSLGKGSRISFSLPF